MQDEQAVREQKLAALRELGMDPYPSASDRDTTCEEALAHFETWSKEEKTITLAGRLLSMRLHGGILFVDLFDGTGKIQIVLKEDEIGSISYARFRDLIDPADFVEVRGALFLTKRGEKTLRALDWRVLVKALLPLPEKWHGLTDVEQRFRKRYLDMIMNPEVRQRLEARSRIIYSIRHFMDRRGYLEVETPTLQPIYGGGFAKPFKTHHHALDADFYLRISDELYLKRLIVGGFPGVYEITKVFRNEGIDHDHSPEFTMFEAQIAYQDYHFGMDIFEELFESVGEEAMSTTEIQHGDVTISIKRPWKRMRLTESILEIGNLDVFSWSSLLQAKDALRPRLPRGKKIAVLDHMATLGEVIAFAFEELVEAQLIQPIIIYDYPVEVSPLAKKTADPRFTERFEAFALGSEIGNNYSELNDPLDLEQRFMIEKQREATGFDEAHQTDMDYLEAIRHGMPPVCGLGIGVDRMVMLLTGVSNLKEIICFPTLRLGS